MDLPPNATPQRTELKQGLITIAYGADTVTGYFISVTDERLKATGTGSEDNLELDMLRESVDTVGDGGGTYLNAHTGKFGFGTRVSVKTMKKLWVLYGADVSGIKE